MNLEAVDTLLNDHLVLDKDALVSEVTYLAQAYQLMIMALSELAILADHGDEGWSAVLSETLTDLAKNAGLEVPK